MDSNIRPEDTPEPGLSDEYRERLTIEMSQLEEDVQALRIQLSAKLNRLNEVKKALGYTTFATFHFDIMDGIHKLEDSDAYKRSAELFGIAKEKTVHAAFDAKEKVESTISALKNSEYMKNLNDKVGSAYSSVKFLCWNIYASPPSLTWTSTIHDAFIHSTYGHPPDDDSEPSINIEH